MSEYKIKVQNNCKDKNNNFGLKTSSNKIIQCKIVQQSLS